MPEKATVLIVDGDRDNRFVLRSLIEGWIPDCSVVVAGNADEAHQLSGSRRIVTALVTMELPGKDGIQLCRELSGPGTRGIPVILVSSTRAPGNHLEAAFEAGAIDFVALPVDEKELAVRVKRVIKLFEKEEALRHYAFMANTIAAPVCLMTGDGRYVAVNDAWCELTGRERGELVGKSIRELYGDSFYESYIQPYEAVLQERTTGRLEIDMEAFGKAPASFEVSYHAFHRPNGDLGHVVLSTHEVSEYKRIQAGLKEAKDKLQELNAALEEKVNRRTAEIQRTHEALLRSEKRTRSITQTAPDGIISVDTNGMILAWNTAAERIFGYTAAEVLNTNVARIVPERLMRLFELSLRRLRTGDKERMTGGPLEMTAVRKNGEEFPIEFSLSYFKSEGEVYYTGIVRDISERKADEIELKRYRDNLEKLVVERTGELVRFAKAVDNSPVSILMTNREGRIEYANQKFFDTCGYSKVEVIGQNPRILKSGVQPSSSYKRLWDTILSGKEWTGELCNRKKNGELFWEYASISSIVDNEGNITHFVAVKEDITERRMAEKRLIEAKEAAEAATKAKSDFLANMSHEIRTPMNALIGMAHLALKTDLNDVQRNYLEKISSASSSLLGIINNILDFSKIEADKVVLENIPFQLVYISEQLLDVFGMKALEKGLSLSFDITPDVPAVLVGDPLRVQQVLTNLVNNALKFTEEGMVSVVVELLSREEDRVILEFSVTDTGIGMTPEQSSRVFDSFSQADESTTRRFGGTGLGLAICQRLVSLMGGEIDVASTPGEGSVFSFTAPFQLPSGERNYKTPVPFDIPPPDLQAKGILLAEDNELNQEVALGLMEDTHAEITVVENGLQAVQAIKEGAFDLVLMDIQMPEMDGLEATRLIRDWEVQTHRKRLPIIAMTASAMTEDQIRVKKAGMDEHIAKPIDPNALYVVLMKWLQN